MIMARSSEDGFYRSMLSFEKRLKRIRENERVKAMKLAGAEAKSNLIVEPARRGKGKKRVVA